MGELFEEHGGTFNMRMLGSNQVATADPDHIKVRVFFSSYIACQIDDRSSQAVLNTEFNNFEKGIVRHFL